MEQERGKSEKRRMRRTTAVKRPGFGYEFKRTYGNDARPQCMKRIMPTDAADDFSFDTPLCLRVISHYLS
jgi:hypothetical protein